MTFFGHYRKILSRIKEQENKKKKERIFFFE